tara:strand:- start:562 stop:1437 length:876 start_codon:yes stop_codon:yes gene_type:complete
MPKIQVIDAATGKIQVRQSPGNQLGSVTKNSYSEATTLAAAKTSTSTSQTGFITGSSSTGNTIFNSVWWSSTGLVVWQSAGRHTIVSGFEGTVGQVEGVSVRLIDIYDPLNQGDRSLDVQISLDGGNNFSTAINSGNLSNTTTADVTVGGKNNTWGLTWPSTFDTSNFQIKGTSVNGRVFAKQAQVTLKHSTTTTTEDVPINATSTTGGDLKDTSKILWTTNVFNSKKNDTWQIHTTGSHGDKTLYFTSETNGWNFIVRDWPTVEGKFNTKDDPDGNEIIVTKSIKSWRNV